MSVHTAQKRISILDLCQRKGGEPIVVLTAYTAPMATLLDPHVDMLLVGDSLGMVVYGENSTLPVTLEHMIDHGKAVVRASHHACVVVDMPFGSYQASPQQAFESCARVMAETGCAAVKLEGGAVMAETITFLVERGIPVMGHIGLMPQQVNTLGGYRYQGRTKEERKRIISDAKAVSKAGAFSIVVEGVAEDIARDITATVPALTIGIGGSSTCDGQVLVTEDMLGLTPRVPRFVKRYANMAEVVGNAVQAYASEVKARSFPAQEHTYPPVKPTT